ncbi:hypothetical protein PZB74_04215 [Porifericola rhodea]|uniref:hypothetical protein n=1 Tax=Porifericola rhodea TaxID=930972 RepID=UPI002665A252|nr:hypothetical protein [Porifericola rhodea]WKN32548.1 hypothetical protein PZB74_04215 [Porifericola rhodea]
MKFKDILIRGLKKGYRLVIRKQFLNPICDLDRQSSNNKIYDLLISDKPCMISRFGTTEINAINNYLTVSSKDPFFKKYVRYITDKTHTPWWSTSHFKYMSMYSGIFPPSQETAEKFSERYLHDIPEIDLLGCHQYYEKYMPLRDDVLKVQLEMLYPFFVNQPWTRVLKKKKVLVVHPFDRSIQSQYRKREKLFQDKNVLPDFELITLRAVQSIADSKVPFENWFDALKYMENLIEKIDFDICLLGCGAYGLPLAAHVKRIGKKAVHIGGGLQLLFGIKGKRWEEQYDEVLHYRPGENIAVNYKTLFNKNWEYPDSSERPQKAINVEGACYW